jgi:hypothetical protein
MRIAAAGRVAGDDARLPRAVAGQLRGRGGDGRAVDADAGGVP